MRFSGIRPDLSAEDKVIKRKLAKCLPRSYSELIRSNIPGSSGCDKQIPCSDTMKGRLKKECRDISKIVMTQASHSSLGVYCDNGFHVVKNHTEINSTRQVKNVVTSKALS